MRLKTFDLDPSHFYSAFGLAWIVKLIELVTDVNVIDD